MSAIRDYLSAIQDKYRTAVAGEHAYRPALQALLEAADSGLNAVNDPARTEIGMPDFVVLHQPGNVPIGVVEAKDIGNKLSRTEKTQQIKRYQKHGNLLLTNYLEFRWYVDKEKVDTVKVARVKAGKIIREPNRYADLQAMLQRFSQQSVQPINSAQELAKRLARTADLIAHFIEKDLKSASPSANLVNQMRAFQRTLLPGLDSASFADMYAQTLAYGLFASRVHYLGDAKRFSLRNAADDIPRSNPFLRDLFYHSRFDLGARLSWLTDSLVEVLRHTDMDSILAHFGRRSGQSDPVVHFYETFLAAYNPSLRERRGVYYTPEPVVKYIVRSVDHILKTRFKRPLGLADENTLILDPAAGTGTFLYFVIEKIKEAFATQQGAWKSYVEKHLLPRIFGFELLMAPYTVAHMNLGLQLKEAGYDFQAGERLGIYLTNTLEEAKEAPELPFAEFISAEANAAAEIKRDKKIMVVLGNPPYSYASANKGEWISKLVRDYYFVDGKPLGERNPKALQDDYVKFIRFAQWRIEQTGEGVLAFITNHGYLDNLTFRGMRQQLLETFDEIYIVNLHGSSIKREVTPEGNLDENVFDIRTGVSISILIKHSGVQKHTPKVMYLDIWGTRQAKYTTLNQATLGSLYWQELNCSNPYFMFKPVQFNVYNEYRDLPSISHAMPVNSHGVATARDPFTIHFSADSLFETVSYFSRIGVETARDHFKLGRDVRDWKVHFAQRDILDSGPSKENVSQITYRPFDNRFTYYTGRTKGFLCMPRREVMSNFFELGKPKALQENFALVTLRRTRIEQYGNFWVTDRITDKSVISSSDNANVFPLFLYPPPPPENL